MLPNRMTFAPMLVVFHLFAACGGSATPMGGGGGAGNIDGGGSAACPDTEPSGGGDCADPSMRCQYVDPEGCPRTFECLQIFVTPSWTRKIPEPGGACSTAGQVCTYSQAVGDNLPMYGALKCADSGKWEKHDVCPPSVPTSGEPCDFPYLVCSYTACGGTNSVHASCRGAVDGWRVDPCPDAGQ